MKKLILRQTRDFIKKEDFVNYFNLKLKEVNNLYDTDNLPEIQKKDFEIFHPFKQSKNLKNLTIEPYYFSRINNKKDPLIDEYMNILQIYRGGYEIFIDYLVNLKTKLENLKPEDNLQNLYHEFYTILNIFAYEEVNDDQESVKLIRKNLELFLHHPNNGEIINSLKSYIYDFYFKSDTDIAQNLNHHFNPLIAFYQYFVKKDLQAGKEALLKETFDFYTILMFNLHEQLSLEDISMLDQENQTFFIKLFDKKSLPNLIDYLPNETQPIQTLITGLWMVKNYCGKFESDFVFSILLDLDLNNKVKELLKKAKNSTLTNEIFMGIMLEIKLHP